ncbi:MAG: hypothetical protein EBX52_09170 [Proteobacteria bacterium]|nr:hypothetical protein [Pseudomonadota bacterium]
MRNPSGFWAERFNEGLILVFMIAGASGKEARASVGAEVKDIEAAVTKLLGHPPRITRIPEAEQLNLRRGSTRSEPWSGSFWPDMIGGIANHYRDHGKLGSQIRYGLRYGIGSARVWNDFKNVCERFPEFSEEERNQKLSPAEKYDLLLGDLKFSFTRAVLEDIDFRAHHLKKSLSKDGEDRDPPEGADIPWHFSDVQASYDPYEQNVLYRYWKKRNDSISYWFGICDGWAPASIYLPRPARPVTVTGALGHRITFYPDDLKALGSYLFARTNNDYLRTMNYGFAGRPCVERGKPATDDSGYVRDFRCNDVDAGLWHLVLLNRIGLDRKGFVIELDNNRKINNHPVGSFSISYFNPLTGDEGSFERSRVARERVPDGYSRRRNPATRFLVGVRSTVTYRYYRWPEGNRDRITDGPAADNVRSKTFEYDLELDDSGRVLGGEWGDRSRENGERVRYAEQPDFIWMASNDALPFSEQSLYTIAGSRIDPESQDLFGNTNWSWDGKSPLPEDWLRAARADATWKPPVVGEVRDTLRGGKEVYPREARDSILKSAEPLSTLVFYLFDRAR